MVVKDRKDASNVDFSNMDEDLKMRRSAAEKEKLQQKFESKISKLNQEIEGIAPNMKVRILICRSLFFFSYGEEKLIYSSLHFSRLRMLSIP